VPEFAADLVDGHRIEQTVYVENRAALTPNVPEAEAFLGETAFVAEIAAESAADRPRPGLCAGIVGYADLRAPEAEAALDRHFEVGSRFLRGIRNRTQREPTVDFTQSQIAEGILLDPAFRRGFAALAPRGLVYDALVYYLQLPELLDLACAFPETTIVVNHCGGVLGTSNHEGRRDETLPVLLHRMRALAACPNVVVKLGGLGMVGGGFAAIRGDDPPDSATLARLWRPIVEPLIEAFGSERAMFESNVPPDLQSGSYRTLWNALKRFAAGASASEKAALFSGTARRVYRLEPTEGTYEA
jgi:L-fuconolactonase